MRVNRAQACAVFGLSRADFDRAVAAGFPAEKRSSSRGQDWSVDLAAGHRWLVARAVADAGLAAAGGGALDLDAERARLAAAQADRVERENARARGELLPADEVKAAVLATFQAVNSRLGAMPATLAHKIRPDDPRAARRHLELAVEEMRAELRRLDLDEARDDAA